jgi:hypothetical protein
MGVRSLISSGRERPLIVPSLRTNHSVRAVEAMLGLGLRVIQDSKEGREERKVMRMKKSTRKKKLLRSRKKTMVQRHLQMNPREELHKTTMRVTSSMMTEWSMRKMAQSYRRLISSQWLRQGIRQKVERVVV